MILFNLLSSTDYLLGKQSVVPKFVIDTDGLTHKQISAIVQLIGTIKDK